MMKKNLILKQQFKYLSANQNLKKGEEDKKIILDVKVDCDHQLTTYQIEEIEKYFNDFKISSYEKEK